MGTIFLVMDILVGSNKSFLFCLFVCGRVQKKSPKKKERAALDTNFLR